MSYCNWGDTSQTNLRYHDEEWGIPVHDDRRQFEFLMLEVMQCGLNWNMIINKREVLRGCFDNFDYDKIANYTDKDVERIINTPGMIKSPRKIQAVIHNAQCFQQVRKEYKTFCNYLWRYSDNKTILYNKHNKGFIPVSNGLSDEISKDLHKRGFKYLGTVVIYSHLQACGLINDHDEHCPRYAYILKNYPTADKKCYLEKGVKDFSERKG